MAWYDTGTVSVTNGSTTVTGSGTNFIAGAQVGEAFYGPDERLYEIQAIVSATSLTLGSPYLGANQTGQDYYIIPTQSLVATLASQVSTLISDFQSVADEAGEGKFNDGTAALPGITFTLDQDTGFSRPAANQIGFSTAGVQRALLSSTALTLTVPLTAAAISGTTGSFSGAVSIADKIVHTGDTDTAIRFPANDTVTVETNGAERLRVTSGGNVGIGSSNPAVPLLVLGSGTSNVTGKFQAASTASNSAIVELLGTNTATTAAQQVFFEAYQPSGGGAAEAALDIRVRRNTDSFGSPSTVMTLRGTGSVGIGTSSPDERLHVIGNVTISGSLSKGSGSFKIDHPVKPDTHHLVHSFIEGPQADNLYRGKVVLVDGSATVNLDEAGRMTEGTFVALNGNVQCFTTNENGWTQVRGKVEGNILTIEAQDTTCTDEVSWLVIGERHDQHMLETSWTDAQGRIITEPEKVFDIQPETDND